MNSEKEYLEVDIEQIQIINKLRNLPRIDTDVAIVNGHTYPTHTIVNGKVLCQDSVNGEIVQDRELSIVDTNVKSIAIHKTLAKIGELLNEKNVVAIREYPNVVADGMLYRCFCGLVYEEKPTTKKTYSSELERLIAEKDRATIEFNNLNRDIVSLEIKIADMIHVHDKLKTHELVEASNGRYDWIERT